MGGRQNEFGMNGEEKEGGREGERGREREGGGTVPKAGSRQGAGWLDWSRLWKSEACGTP